MPEKLDVIITELISEIDAIQSMSPGVETYFRNKKRAQKEILVKLAERMRAKHPHAPQWESITDEDGVEAQAALCFRCNRMVERIMVEKDGQFSWTPWWTGQAIDTGCGE